MGQIVVIVVVLVLAVVVFAWARRKVAADGGGILPVPGDAPVAAPSGPLAGLGVGATVVHDGRDHVVSGAVRFTEDGTTWTAYHLDPGGPRRTWLMVDGADAALWESVEASGLVPDRGSVTHEGRTYRKAESGRAAFASVGATGRPTSGQAWYADFRAEGGRLLGFERWSPDGAWEVSTGVAVPVDQLVIAPAGAAAG